MECEGVGFIHGVATVAGDNVVLVGVALSHLRHKRFPDSGTRSRRHFQRGFVPAVEISHDINLLGIGRPDCEVRSSLSVHFNRVSAKVVIQLNVAAFIEQVEVVIA